MKNDRTEIHHLIPKYKGGDNNPENLTVVCPGCHKIIQAWLYFLDLMEVA